MKRLFALLFIGMAVAFGTASTAQAHDRDCYRSHSSYRSRGDCYPRTYSSGYCRPQTYYSRPACPPPVYYRSYNCEPRRYYSTPCYPSRSFSISVPGFGFFFGR